jgi:predicted transcriptional regulator
MAEKDWLDPADIDQRTLFEGNSVLRGQQPRVDELEQIPERIKDLVFK